MQVVPPPLSPQDTDLEVIKGVKDMLRHCLKDIEQ